MKKELSELPIRSDARKFTREDALAERARIDALPEAERRQEYARQSDERLQWAGPGYILKSQVLADHPSELERFEASGLTVEESKQYLAKAQVERQTKHDELVSQQSAKAQQDADQARAEAQNVAGQPLRPVRLP